MADLSDTIATNAASPKSVQTDAGSATAQPIPDQIEADRYLKGNAAAAAAAADGKVLTRVMRFGRCVPPGAV